MSKRVEIRAIYRLYQQGFKEKTLMVTPFAAVAKAVEAGTILTEKRQGKLVGFLRYHINKRRHIAQLLQIFVVSTHRRQGIGSKLLRRFERLARKHERYTLRLKTGETNGAAQQFYRNHGFQRFKTVEGKVREVHYEKVLPIIPIGDNGITPAWIRRVLRKVKHRVSVAVTVEPNGEYWIWFNISVTNQPICAMTRGSIMDVVELVKQGKTRFSEGLVKWQPRQVAWSDTAKAHKKIVRHRYKKNELRVMTVAELKEIARVKGLSLSGRKSELITRLYLQ